ncbi:hypothetical protein Gohar_018812 [Gossypium harknessii]|uniref:Uncharacterized protein n=1 Tax=Gossypium harknessii TaxID=34285 RepID=A0A7J9GA89_9ROSI|nr:hypothetical protein [Gossypium harknessii]
MGWLEENFKRINVSTSDVEKEQSMCAFILRLIVVRDQWCWRYCTKKCVGRRNQKKLKSTVTSSFFNRGYGTDYHFYGSEWIPYEFPLVICLGVRNVFRRYARISMTYTRSTCGGDSRKIDQDSTRSISRCGNVDSMDWLRHNDKLYLLLDAERSRQRHLRRST